MQKLNRRGFFSQVAKLTGAAIVAPSVINTVFSSQAQAGEKRGGGAAAGGAACSLPVVEPGKGTAAAVKYVTKSAEAGKTCANCSFYNTAKQEKCNGADASTCTIFAGQLVMAAGYCASWNKKA